MPPSGEQAHRRLLRFAHETSACSRLPSVAVRYPGAPSLAVRSVHRSAQPRPPSGRPRGSRLALLATDHSGRADALRTARACSGLKCLCPRRQHFTRSGPPDLGRADRDGRGYVAASGECAGRSLRAGRREWLVGRPPRARSRSRPQGAREGATESAQTSLSVGVAEEIRDVGAIAVSARERLRRKSPCEGRV